MDFPRFLDCLAADFTRLRAVVPTAPTAAVPTCPGWTVADLTRHVGEVYLHKTIAILEGAEPQPWPPRELADEEPIALLDRAYTGLLDAFGSHTPEDHAGAWYAPNQTVGFWMRRMAHETVIHRIDAEMATRQPVAPVPDDLATDGIDELLKVFVAYSVATWGKYFTDVLGSSAGHTFTIGTDGRAWRVRTAPGTFTVSDGAGAAAADATISGPPMPLLRWVWNREARDAPGGVTIAGAPEAVEQLKRCIATATQ